jgi:hypothetical protein
MAIAFDAQGDAFNGGGTQSATASLTVAGTDRGMVIVALTNGGDVVTSVTYNGVAATRVLIQSLTDIDANQRAYIYYLNNPDTGTHDAVVNTSVNTEIEVYAISYTGVSQSSQPHKFNSGSGTGNLTVSVTTTDDNCWLVGYGRANSSGAMGAGAGTTLRGTGTTLNAGDSNSAKTPAGSHGLAFTNGSATTSYVGIIALSPAVAAGPTNLKSYNTNLKANIKSINTNPIANVKSLNTNV